MSNNGISTLTYKQQRQVAKLDLAKLKRQGYTLYTDGTRLLLDLIVARLVISNKL
jgi:hypothetical protein